MKRTSLLYLLFGLICVIALGCKKHNSTTIIPSGMSADIDGVKWVATTFVANRMSFLSVTGDSVTDLLISGYDIDPLYATTYFPYNEIDIEIAKYKNEPGIYSIRIPSFDTVSSVSNYDGPGAINLNSGTITITKITANNVQGTFTGTYNDTLYGTSFSITNGQFNINIL